jgi:hypothetical protein
MTIMMMFPVETTRVTATETISLLLLLKNIRRAVAASCCDASSDDAL